MKYCRTVHSSSGPNSSYHAQHIQAAKPAAIASMEKQLGKKRRIALSPGGVTATATAHIYPENRPLHRRPPAGTPSRSWTEWRKRLQRHWLYKRERRRLIARRRRKDAIGQLLNHCQWLTSPAACSYLQLCRICAERTHSIYLSYCDRCK